MGILKAKEVESALRQHDGNMAAVGRKFGVTREAVRQFVEKHPSLKAVCLECRESMKDTAESSLYKAVKKGASWAVQFYLRTQGRDRGYSEKQDGDKPPDGAQSSQGVPVELVTRMFALLGGGTGTPPPALPVDTQPRPAEPRVPESSG